MTTTSAELPFVFGTKNALQCDSLILRQAVLSKKYTPEPPNRMQKIKSAFRSCNFDLYTYLIVSLQSISAYCFLYTFGLDIFGLDLIVKDLVNGIASLIFVNILAVPFVLALGYFQNRNI